MENKKGPFKINLIENAIDLPSSLGISSKRSDELIKMFLKLIDGKNSKDPKGYKISEAFQILVEQCDTLEEVVAIAYIVGLDNGMLKGPLTSPTIIHIGIARTSNSEENRPGDSIEDLIKQSYKINGGTKD